MNITAYIDPVIPEDELREVISRFNELYAPLNPQWNIIREDMSNLEWVSFGGSQCVKFSYLKTKVRTNHTLLWIAHENYLPAQNNSWGWNLPNVVPGKHIHLCRFDTDREWRESRIVNTFGTLVHEVAHSHDAQIYNKLGKQVEQVLGMAPGEYDSHFVHGKSPRFEYIGRNEDINADVIRQEIMPLLVQAYEINKKINLLQKALGLVRQIITLKKKKAYETIL